MELIQDLSPYTEELFSLNEFHLQYLRRFEDGYGVSKDDFCEMPKGYPALYQELVHMGSQYAKVDKTDVAPESLIGLKYITKNGGSMDFVH